jgi:hypothetical protein
MDETKSADMCTREKDLNIHCAYYFSKRKVTRIPKGPSRRRGYTRSRERTLQENVSLNNYFRYAEENDKST